MRARLDKKVDQFVQKYASNAKQRSDEWYTLTKTTIGGSELAVVLGISKYKTLYDLAKEKAGLLPGFTGNMATMWGTIFEDIVARFIELDCNTTIKGAELTIRDIPGIRYSPDGYAVVRVHRCPSGDEPLQLVTRDLPCFADDQCPHCQHLIVLIEIKCPRSRKPVEGEIPEHYKPQLLSGLIFSPMTRWALFTEAVIKRRPLSAVLDKESVAWGLLAVYSNNPLQVVSSDPAETRAVVDTTIGNIYDLGKCNLKYLEDYLKKICDHSYEISYTDPVFTEETNNVTVDSLLVELKQRTPSNQYLVAVLPWTIHELYYTFQDRDPNYLQKILGPVKKFNALLRNLLLDPDYIEKYVEKEQEADDFSNLFT
jgi:putative phage-type endonuclease